MKWYTDFIGFVLHVVFLSVLLHFGGMETLVVFFFAWVMWNMTVLKVYTKPRLRDKGGKRQC